MITGIKFSVSLLKTKCRLVASLQRTLSSARSITVIQGNSKLTHEACRAEQKFSFFAVALSWTITFPLIIQ